jgi:hypothetical protein
LVSVDQTLDEDRRLEIVIRDFGHLPSPQPVVSDDGSVQVPALPPGRSLLQNEALPLAVIDPDDDDLDGGRLTHKMAYLL